VRRHWLQYPHHHHHHHHPHRTTGLTWCRHSSASEPRYKVNVTDVVTVSAYIAPAKFLHVTLGYVRIPAWAVAALRCGKAVQIHCQFVAMHCQLHCLYFYSSRATFLT